jgi:CRISPR/Cas system-associated endonuclease Cas1
MKNTKVKVQIKNLNMIETIKIILILSKKILKINQNKWKVMIKQKKSDIKVVKFRNKVLEGHTNLSKKAMLMISRNKILNHV